MTNLNKLLSIAKNFSDKPNSLKIEDIDHLYKINNGFIAFEGALLCFPDFMLENINNDEWKDCYGESVSKTVFFAADLFGHMFGVLEKKIVKFNPESGRLVLHSDDLETWAAKIISDYDYETGWSLSRSWQLANKPLDKIERLVPLIPFCLGGEFAVENLVNLDIYSVLKQYSGLYSQVKNIEKGQKVKVNNWLISS